VAGFIEIYPLITDLLRRANVTGQRMDKRTTRKHSAFRRGGGMNSDKSKTNKMLSYRRETALQCAL